MLDGQIQQGIEGLAKLGMGKPSWELNTKTGHGAVELIETLGARQNFKLVSGRYQIQIRTRLPAILSF